ncbi:MAG TPA: RDD family protein [Thermoanaerobaculia bacterium]|nr:RDD family protein [Thermoanaerobaculia bacterium]
MACLNHAEVEEGLRPCSRCGQFFCGDCLVEIQQLPYCATCKSEQILDLRSGMDATRLDFAHIGRRLLAMWIDSVLFSIPIGILYAIGMVAIVFVAPKWMEQNPMIFCGVIGLLTLLMIIGMTTYEALMLAKKNGQTLGKMALKIRVVNVDGGPITPRQAWGRAITRQLLIHVLQVINYIPAFLTKEKTCVHDMLAKTRVVRAD